MMKNKKLLITFIFFLLAMIMGWFLRLQFVYPTGGIVKYKHLLHAHSHVILLGWVFNALYLSITSIYHPKGSTKHKKFRLLFWFIQVTILLAMIGFLIQGYALFSILFSTAFLVGTFFWAAWIWKDVKNDKRIGGRFISLSILCLLLSSLGPLSLGAIMNIGLKETAVYPLSIYFYLHFLYNGFFILGLIGVWFHYLDEKRIQYQKEYARYFYLAMKWSIIPLYALSVVWLSEHISINIISAIASAVQIGGGYYLFKMIYKMNKKPERQAHFIPRLLAKIVLVIFGIKLTLQLASSHQWVSDLALQAKSYFIIGYIHLIMLGLISVFILWHFLSRQWISINNRWAKTGIYIFLSGVFLSEILLFLQGSAAVFFFIQIPYYYG